MLLPSRPAFVHHTHAYAAQRTHLAKLPQRLSTHAAGRDGRPRSRVRHDRQCRKVAAPQTQPPNGATQCDTLRAGPDGVCCILNIGAGDYTSRGHAIVRSVGGTMDRGGGGSGGSAGNRQEVVTACQQRCSDAKVRVRA